MRYLSCGVRNVCAIESTIVAAILRCLQTTDKHLNWYYYGLIYKNSIHFLRVGLSQGMDEYCINATGTGGSDFHPVHLHLCGVSANINGNVSTYNHGRASLLSSLRDGVCRRCARFPCTRGDDRDYSLDWNLANNEHCAKIPALWLLDCARVAWSLSRFRNLLQVTALGFHDLDATSHRLKGYDFQELQGWVQIWK